MFYLRRRDFRVRASLSYHTLLAKHTGAVIVDYDVQGANDWVGLVTLEALERSIDTIIAGQIAYDLD